MKRGMAKVMVPIVLLGLMIVQIGCGGGGSSSDSVNYNGSNDPAVADSTTATPLAQTGLNASSAGFPVVQAFFMEDPGAEPVSVQPLADYAGTDVTLQIPSDAVFDGADMGGGEGTMKLAGSLLLWVEDRSAGGMTWTIANATMNGSITFNGYYNGMGSVEEQLAGTVAVTDTSVIFSNDPVEFPLTDLGPAIVNYLDLPTFTDIAVTFTDLTVGTGADSYSLGEGDLEISLGSSGVDVVINSLTAEGGGESYKIEDGHINVSFTLDGDDIVIDGSASDYMTVYHSTLGMFYFYASFIEDDQVGDITSGIFEISEDGLVADVLFHVSYNPTDLTYYNSFMDLGSGWEIIEKGYLLDWEFTPDPTAPDVPPT